MASSSLDNLITQLHDDEIYEYDSILNNAVKLNTALNWLDGDRPVIRDQEVYDNLVEVLGDKIEALALAKGWPINLTASFVAKLRMLYNGSDGVVRLKPPYHDAAKTRRRMSDDEYMLYFLGNAMSLYMDPAKNRNGSYVQPINSVIGDLNGQSYEDLIENYRSSMNKDITLVIGDVRIDVSMADLLARYNHFIDIFEFDEVQDGILDGELVLDPGLVSAMDNSLSRIPQYEDYSVENLIGEVITSGKILSDNLEKQLQLSAIDGILGSIHGQDEVMNRWGDNTTFSEFVGST